MNPRARAEYARHAEEPRHADLTTAGLTLVTATLLGAIVGGLVWVVWRAVMRMFGGPGE